MAVEIKKPEFDRFMILRSRKKQLTRPNRAVAFVKKLKTLQLVPLMVVICCDTTRTYVTHGLVQFLN